MSHEENGRVTAQVIGSAAFILAAALLVRFAWRSVCSETREALLAAAAMLVSVVGFRMLAAFEVISQVDARVYNGMVGVAFAVILIQAEVRHLVSHRKLPQWALAPKSNGDAHGGTNGASVR